MDFTKANDLRKNVIALAGKPEAKMYNEAEEQKMSVSELLELRDPSQPDDKLDAFQRQFFLEGLSLGDNPMKVSTYGELANSQISHLAPEFVRRQVLRGMTMVRTFKGNLIAIETRVEGNTFTPMYLRDKTTKGGSMKLTGAGATMATWEIFYGEKTINVQKYGKALNVDYDVVKRKSLTEFQLILWLVGKNLEEDQVTEIEAVIRAGDGTVGAPSSTSAATSGAANMVYGDFVDVLLDFDTLFDPNRAFMTTTQAKAFLKMAEIKDPLAFTSFTQKGQLPTPFGFTIVRCGGSDTYITFIDSQFAIIRGVETALTLEADKIIARRMDEVTIYEAIAYAIGVSQARRLLTFA